MIRFIDNFGQEYGGVSEKDEYQSFSFFDTVTDQHIILNGSTVFDSYDDFVTAYNLEYGNNEFYDIERFTIKIPKKFR